MKPLLLLITAIALSLPAQANKPAWSIAQAPLLASPSYDAEQIHTIAKDQAVLVLQRVKAWYQVQTEAGNKGWVKMLALRFEGPDKESSSGLLSLWKNVTSSESETTVATGIRGFEEEDMDNATPSLNSVEQLDNYQASAEQAQQFAKQGKLNSNTVAAP